MVAADDTNAKDCADELEEMSVFFSCPRENTHCIRCITALAQKVYTNTAADTTLTSNGTQRVGRILPPSLRERVGASLVEQGWQYQGTSQL
jgi:hypothetical protein